MWCRVLWQKRNCFGKTWHLHHQGIPNATFNYMASHPKGSKLHSHCCEKLKLQIWNRFSYITSRRFSYTLFPATLKMHSFITTFLSYTWTTELCVLQDYPWHNSLLSHLTSIILFTTLTQYFSLSAVLITFAQSVSELNPSKYNSQFLRSVSRYKNKNYHKFHNKTPRKAIIFSAYLQKQCAFWESQAVLFSHAYNVWIASVV
jgi:hypothetical protein